MNFERLEKLSFWKLKKKGLHLKSSIFGDRKLKRCLVNHMEIITEKTKIPNNFWLHFYLNGDGGEFLDADLPFPHYHKHSNKGFYVAWMVEGYFHTKRGQNYLNDTIARFLITFKNYEARRLPYKPKDTKNLYLARAIKLKELSGTLESIKNKRLAPTRADSFADSVFWAIKLFAEDMIRETEFIVFDTLQNWALTQFEEKEFSTIKAKCRSVWNYYHERDFKLNEYQRTMTDEELEMSRSDHAKKINEKRKQETEAKILAAITYLEKKEQKITAKAIAEFSGLHQNTLSKYKHLWKK